MTKLEQIQALLMQVKNLLIDTSDKQYHKANRIYSINTVYDFPYSSKPEPKPLLADAQIGWVCTHRNGAKSTVLHGYDFYTLRTSYGIEGSYFSLDGWFYVSRESEHDIISCEPPVKKSEPQTDLSISGEHQYQVGDWVEVDEQGMFVHCYLVPKPETNTDISFLLYDISYPKRWVGGIFRNKSNSHIIRKLNPSEVIVDFGNGIKGCIEYNTLIVRNNGSKQIDKSWISVFNGDIIIAKISIKALMTDCRKLVEKLLEAQEKEGES